jgi:hypothetical protein
MRLLIANHIDASLLRQVDQRTFTQRVFWFCSEGDVVVLSDAPDADFVSHVTGLLQVNSDRLTILVNPSHKYGGLLFDPAGLSSPELVAQLKPLVANCTEILSLWPSAEIVDLAYRLGIPHAIQGKGFLCQNGDAFANSKCTFRALAAGAGVPIPHGFVCRSIDSFSMSLRSFIAEDEPVMIKQDHNFAGAGNYILWPSGRSGAGTAGAANARCISLDELDELIPELWNWASGGDRHPVVVEAFKHAWQTVYFEFLATDAGVVFQEMGRLEYESGQLLREHTPVDPAGSMPNVERWKRCAQILADTYHSIGYRGYMSADAIVSADGDVLFTEMNARIGGSPHIYAGIWRRVVRLSSAIDRCVIQYLTPTIWRPLATREVIDALSRLGLLYDRRTRTGTILSIPPHPSVRDGSYLLTVVTVQPDEQPTLLQRLDDVFVDWDRFK